MPSGTNWLKLVDITWTKNNYQLAVVAALLTHLRIGYRCMIHVVAVKHMLQNFYFCCL